MAKAKRIPVGELLRLACLYAEQDRESFIAAIGNGEPECIAENESFLQQLREYRVRRWGRTRHEKIMDKAVLKNVAEIIAEHGIEGPFVGRTSGAGVVS